MISNSTDWCAGMVPVPKPNGKVRFCVDLKQLNFSAQRWKYPIHAVNQILAQLTAARVFSKLDANLGFWQIPLSCESLLLTTITSPFGLLSSIMFLLVFPKDQDVITHTDHSLSIIADLWYMMLKVLRCPSYTKW